MDLGLGTVLLGKYRVDEVLGTGGMGRVVRASHLYLQQSVAIKILLTEMVESANTVSRFLQEAQSTVKLRSEHIARVYDVGTAPDGCPFIIMEFLEGNDLNQVLRHHGPQQPQVVCDLMLQACEGIAEAHALGIVHRDIKPSNFFITRRIDGTMLLKILDFGISKSPKANLSELTGTQTIIGTPTYMAPEQMKSGKETGPRSDIWSMGIVMYQLLNGRPPFHGESYAELVIKVNTEPPAPMHVALPAGLGEVILRCLEKDVRFRLQNVAELARMLAPFATDPLAGAQSAARTSRILQQRSGMTGQQGLAITAGGGLATPVPHAPPQFTPRSWPPTGSSVSQGAGQMTVRTRSNRGWIIAGVASIVIIAGASGYIVSSVVNHDTKAATTSPPPPAEDPPVTEPTPPTVPAPTPKVAAPTPTVAAPTVAATTPTPTVAAPTPTPTVAAPTIPPKAEATGSGSGSAAAVREPTVTTPTPTVAKTTPTVPTPTVTKTTPTVTKTAPTPTPTKTTPTKTTPTPTVAKTTPTVAKTTPTVAKTTPTTTDKPAKPSSSSKKKKKKTRNDDELFGGRK